MSESLPADLLSTVSGLPLAEFENAVEPLPLTAEERQAADAVRGFIDEQPQETFLARVEAVIGADDARRPGPDDPHHDIRREALRAWWYFGQGIDAGGARLMDEAARCYRQAAYGFARLGNKDQLDECVIQGVICEASSRIQANDTTEGERLLAEARRLLQANSRIGPGQRETLAGLEVEIMYQRSGQAVRQGDQTRAELLLRKAAEQVDALAGGHSDTDPAHAMLAGQAGLLRAQAAFLAGSRAVSLYNFDDIDAGESAAAARAAYLLKEHAHANAALAAFYSEVLGVLEQLAAIMLRVLGSSFRTEKGEFHALHERIRAARKVIPAAAGADAIGLSQGCDQLTEWLHNLERLAKPSKKDLVILGGLTACIAFCALLLVVAIVNRTFALGASAATILTTCTTLAIAAGFGVPGLRALRSGSSSGDAS